MKQPNVWQIASGDRGRDYGWLFLKHDLIRTFRGFDPCFGTNFWIGIGLRACRCAKK